MRSRPDFQTTPKALVRRVHEAWPWVGNMAFSACVRAGPVGALPALPFLVRILLHLGTLVGERERCGSLAALTCNVCVAMLNQKKGGRF